MSIMLVFILGLIQIPATALTPQQSSALNQLMLRGQGALKAQDYATAQKLLEQAVALKPADPEIRYLLGRAYGEDKKNQPAIVQFQEVLKLAPGHPGALIDLASIEENTGKFPEANAHYREALKAGPNPKAERGLASLVSRQGQAAEGIEILRKLLAADPNDWESHYQLGLVLMQQGDCEKATVEFETTLKLKPDYPAALFNLGNCLNRLGKKDDGGQTLARFQEISKRDEANVARKRRGYFLLLQADQQIERGDGSGAIKSLQEAVTVNPDDPAPHAVLGQILDEKGDIEAALAAYRRAAELSPEDPVILVETGRLLCRLNRFDEGLVFLKKAAQVAPSMPEPHMLMAAAYHQLGRKAEASAEEAIWRRLSVDRKP